jgi:hypothetical protein
VPFVCVGWHGKNIHAGHSCGGLTPSARSATKRPHPIPLARGSDSNIDRSQRCLASETRRSWTSVRSAQQTADDQSAESCLRTRNPSLDDPKRTGRRRGSPKNGGLRYGNRIEHLPQSRLAGLANRVRTVASMCPLLRKAAACQPAPSRTVTFPPLPPASHMALSRPPPWPVR